MRRRSGTISRFARVLLVLFRRRKRQLWRNLRTSVNVSWLALRDPAIGRGPKALGALAALIGVAPLEWVPHIHPLAVLAANFLLIPALIWLAWARVATDHKERLIQTARGRSTPWSFFALVAGGFATGFSIDLAMDLSYPGQDAFSPTIDAWVKDLLGEGAF